MKKRVLFSLLTIFLAGLWLGGVSMAATSLPCSSDAAVACIWEDWYATLEAAIAAVPTNWTETTIVLISGFESNNFSIPSNTNINLDLNWNTLTLDNNGYYNYVDWNLTINDNWNGWIRVSDFWLSPRAWGK